MFRELEQSIRGLLRSPAHSGIVILTMALGIGATATIASIVNGVLLRPLPFRDPERLMMLWQRAPGVGVEEDWLSPAQYFDLREKVRGFEDLGMVFGTNVTLTGDGAEPERLGALNVSSSFFDLLGIEPDLGRRLTAEDDVPGSAVKVLLSESLYLRRFAGNPAILGRTLSVDGERLEVAGVLPPLPLDEDLLPTLNTVPGFDLVTSLPIEDPGITTHASENYNVIGRLAHTTTPTEALREGSTAVRARSLWRGGSRYFVIVQVALSLVLATGAGLLLRTFFELRSTPPGFRPEDTLSFRVSLVGERYEERSARDRFFELLFERIRGASGVSDAGGISMLPLTRGFAWTDFLVQDQKDPERNRVVADVHVVTPGYFEAMGIPLLAGRTFTNADDGEPLEVVVNRALAERFWTIDEAVGKWVARRPVERAAILGVVENVKHYGLGTEPRMTVFFPYEAYASRTLYGVAHGPGGTENIAPRVIEAVRALDPQIPVYDSRTMIERLSDSLARERILMMLLLLFSGIALTLATVGLYGVLSFSVATHTRELGIRKAVGATRGDLYQYVLRGALAVVGMGIALGLAAALLCSRPIQGLLYGVDATDPLTLAAAAILLLAVGLGASLLPARRAAGIDPVIALKE